MYQVWSLYYGEFLVLGVWGIVLALARRILFGELCKDAALGSGGKGRMLKAMTLKFQKSHEVNVGICDMQVFVRKYLCQEKKFGISLGQWRHLPERWTGILFGIGFVEAAALHYLGYEETFCLNRLLAAATAAAISWRLPSAAAGAVMAGAGAATAGAAWPPTILPIIVVRTMRQMSPKNTVPMPIRQTNRLEGSISSLPKNVMQGYCINFRLKKQ